MSTHTFTRIPLMTRSRDIITHVSGKAEVTLDEDGTLRRILELHVYDVGHVLLEILQADPLYFPIADALQLDINSAINARPSTVDAEPESA